MLFHCRLSREEDCCTVSFSGFGIWEGVSQLMGVKLFSFSMVQCTILQQNGKYNNISTLLLGPLLYPNNYDDLIEVFYSHTLEKCIYDTCTCISHSVNK